MTEHNGEPEENLKERDDAEAKAEAKEASQRGNEVHWTHSDAPLQLLKLSFQNSFWRRLKVYWSFTAIQLCAILTHHSVFAKEDVDNSNVLVPSIVVFVLQVKDREV